MSRADQELGYRARVAMNSREPKLRSPDQSEFGVVLRRGEEVTPRPDGTRYRPARPPHLCSPGGPAERY